MRDYESLPGYDAWKTTNPDDEFLGPEPEDEDEIEEPTVEEVWDGSRGEYVHVVTFASGRQFYIQQAHGGAFVGEFEIVGHSHPKYESVGFYADGYSSPEKAIDYLIDMVMS